MSSMAGLVLCIQDREGEIGRELSSGFEFGARQAQGPSVIPLSQHLLHFPFEEAPRRWSI